MIQTLPSVVMGLYTRFFNGWALLIGWTAGFGVGTYLVILNGFSPVYPFKLMDFTFPCYIALATMVLNIVVSLVLSVVLNAVASDRHKDSTVASDYV